MSILQLRGRCALAVSRHMVFSNRQLADSPLDVHTDTRRGPEGVYTG